MLRKYTSFFDSTLEFLGEKTEPYEMVCALEQKLVQLIRDISVGIFSNYHNDQQNQAEKDFRQRLVECFRGHWHGGLNDEDAKSFKKACKSVYRLETLLRFPWDDETDGPIRYRRLCLSFSFFQKATKEAFYRMTFDCSKYDGTALTVDIHQPTLASDAQSVTSQPAQSNPES